MLRQSSTLLVLLVACVAFVGATTEAHPAASAAKALGLVSTANTEALLPATADAAEKHSDKALTRKRLQKGLSILFGKQNHKPKGKPGEGSSGDKAGSDKPSLPYPFHKHQSR
jgi:hypothetical protein